MHYSDYAVYSFRIWNQYLTIHNNFVLIIEYMISYLCIYYFKYYAVKNDIKRTILYFNIYVVKYMNNYCTIVINNLNAFKNKSRNCKENSLKNIVDYRILFLIKYILNL